MSRLSDAWAALCGQKPHMISADSVALVRVFEIPEYAAAGAFVFVSNRRYYASCEQAHQAEPGAKVSAVQALSIGGKLYRAPDGLRLAEITLQPKPKRAKGAKA